MTIRTSSAPTMATRLLDAINQHDLETLTDCFAPDFINETPLHPARSFTGREQVRKNWSQIFAGLPDVRADILHQTVDGGTVWMELELRGTRPDGKPSLFRGITILGTHDDRFAWVRFYLEPVEEDGPGIDAALRQQLGR